MGKDRTPPRHLPHCRLSLHDAGALVAWPGMLLRITEILCKSLLQLYNFFLFILEQLATKNLKVNEKGDAEYFRK